MNIMVRLENLADLFDYPEKTTLDQTNIVIDLMKIANSLYSMVNGESALLDKIDIVEVELTGIISY